MSTKNKSQAKRKNLENEIKKYLQLKYRIEMIPGKEEGGFVAIIPDLPGCISQGENEAEALKMIAEAKAAWIKATVESGKEVPVPRDQFSGKLNIRIPKTLHQRLTLESEREGVSLNQEIIAALERGLVRA
ncbi:MAG: type II toxin-antitoxin system HicB family antitoxin [Candidatus Omnitrophica bacterium]|nr:type II toxin-antitoxin system HicB family antitoxin [Candidatus Omnitrophota bacterium]